MLTKLMYKIFGEENALILNEGFFNDDDCTINLMR